MRARFLKLGILALLVPVLGACVDEDAGPTVVTDKGSLNVGLDLVALGIPTGQVSVDFDVADLDTVNHPVDLFDRAEPILSLWSSRLSGNFETATDYGRKDVWAGRWFKDDQFGSQPDDPRRPLLVQNPNVNDIYPDAMDFLRIRSFESFAGQFCTDGPCWTIYTDLDVLGPDEAWVAVGFARYGVQVNGLPDHLEIFVEGTVTQPDSLVLLGGAPGGYPQHNGERWHNFGDPAPWQEVPSDSPEACPAAQATANPFLFGHTQLGGSNFTNPRAPDSNYDGELQIGWCFSSEGVWSDAKDGPVPAIAPNTFESFDLPRYNYVVVWEYDKANEQVLYDRPLFRAQLGIDLDVNGNPLPHAFAPFPYPPGHEFASTTGPFATRTEFLEDPRVAPGASDIDLTLENLGPLAGGASYQVWLFDEVEGETVRVPVTYVALRPDTVGTDDLGEPIVEFVPEGEPQTVQSFPGSRTRKHSIAFNAADLQAAGIVLRSFTHVVVTVSEGGDASPVDSPAPVWFRFTDQQGTRTDFFDNEINRAGTARFGFIPELAGRGAGWELFGGGSVEFLHTEALGVRLSRLARPPLGYYYAVWLENEETGQTRNLGPITTPAPEYSSLRDADILPVDGEFLTPREILTAWKWQEWDEVPEGFAAFTHVIVTLESKAGPQDQMSLTRIFEAVIPPDLDKIPVETPRR